MSIIISSIIQTIFHIDIQLWIADMLSVLLLLSFILLNSAVMTWISANIGIVYEYIFSSSEQEAAAEKKSKYKPFLLILKNYASCALQSADADKKSALPELIFFTSSFLSLLFLPWGQTHCNLPSPVSFCAAESSMSMYISLFFLLTACLSASLKSSKKRSSARTVKNLRIFTYMLLSLAAVHIFAGSSSLSDIISEQMITCLYISIFGLGIFPAAAGALTVFAALCEFTDKDEAADLGRVSSVLSQSSENDGIINKISACTFLFSLSALTASVFLGGWIIPKYDYPPVIDAGFAVIPNTDMLLGAAVLILKAYFICTTVFFIKSSTAAAKADRIKGFIFRHASVLLPANLLICFIFNIVKKLCIF